MKPILVYTFLILLWLPNSLLGQTTVGFLVPVSGLGDQSFNDMTYAGLIRAKNIYKFKLIREISAGSEPDDHRRAMDKLIDQGANVIVTNGWEFTDVIKEYAPKYSDRFFIINDFPLSGLPNVISTVFDQHEGSFLAGALAAWTTKTGKIGFIGGKDMPVIRAFWLGYRQGAKYADKNIEIVDVFLSEKNEATSGFDNPALAYNKANALYKQGVDVIFSVAGLAGNGIIRSAAQNKKYAIGVDADQDHMAKGYVLTSVIKRLDKATIEALSIIFDGKFSPGIHSFGLKEKGVTLSPMTYTHHLIPEEIQSKIKEIQKQIISGAIKVSNYLDQKKI